MQKRLLGREQELGIRILPAPKSRLITRSGDYFTGFHKDILDAIIERISLREDIPTLQEQPRYNRIWLGNGSLMYIDNFIFEVATAECLAGSLDLLAQEKATEKILTESADEVARQRGLQSISFYKNNVGPDGESVGRDLFREVTYAGHHNYSYKVDKFHVVIDLLVNFLTASLPFSGSGHVYRDYSGRFYYHLSQRANHICQLQGTETTQSRPLVNLRMESLMHSDAKLGRLHLISRDATRCEFQTWLVDMMTHLVLRLAEEGWKLPAEQRIRSALVNFHQINSSFMTNPDFVLDIGSGSDNQTLNIFDYNRLFLDAAKQLNPLSENEKKALQEWERVLDLLKAKAFDKLVGELDWATKWFLLQRKMKKHNFDLSSVRAWKIDMSYHNISSDPNRSQFAALDEAGYIKHLITPEDIAKAKTTPPQNTRAKSRGELVKFCAQSPFLKGLIEDLNWAEIKLKDERGFFYFGEADNPFSPDSPALEDFCRKLKIK